VPVTPPPVPTLRRIVLGAWAGLVALALAAAPALGASAMAPSASAGGQTAAATSPAPVSLAVLVPLTVRPTTTGLIDATALAGYTAPLGVLTRQLDAVIGTPAVIGLDPMIIASIRVLGAAAPTSATSWLERLQASGNQVFALAYADADLAALAQAVTDYAAQLCCVRARISRLSDSDELDGLFAYATPEEFENLMRPRAAAQQPEASSNAMCP